MSKVPVIDLGPAFTGGERERRAVAKEIGRACEDIGFLMVTGHGISRALVKEAEDVSRKFFERPLEEKMRIVIRPGQSRRGYRSVGASTLVARPGQEPPPPDLRESFVSGPQPIAGDPYFQTKNAERFFEPNVWPEHPSGMQLAFDAYYTSCALLAFKLMRLFALALEMPETFFDDKINHHISGLNATRYPKQTIQPKPGQLRAGQHTDYGSLTILATDGSPGGLQVWLDGDWQDVMPVPDAFIINLGDLMAQWTNERWRSTLHRVVNPPQDVAPSTDRLSLVFFHQPNFDAPVECLSTCVASGDAPKFNPTTSGEHLMAEIARTYARQTEMA